MPKNKKNKKEKPYRTFTFEANRTIFLEVEARNWKEAKEMAIAQLDEILLGYFNSEDNSVAQFFEWTEAENAEASLPPKCPECGETISYLNHFPNGYACYTFWLAKDGKPKDVYEDFQIQDNSTDDEYCCPECGEKLFKTAKEAEEFLRWGKVAIRPK